MPYSLWRNEVLLGVVRLVFPTDDARLIAGMFEPTAEFHAVGATIQFRAAILPNAPVLQERLPSHPPKRQPTEKGPRDTPLRRLTEAEARGVEPELQLELRDAVGRSVATELLFLQQEQLSEAALRGALAEACAALGVPYSGWMLQARRHGTPGDDA